MNEELEHAKALFAGIIIEQDIEDVAKDYINCIKQLPVVEKEEYINDLPW